MRCADCIYNRNCSLQEIAEDITGCEGHSKSRELEDGQCKCDCCKRIFTLKENHKIFQRKDNPKRGVCFNCYYSN